MADGRIVDRAALLQLLQDLIRTDSVNPSLVPGGCGEMAIARNLGELFAGMGLEARLQEIAPGRFNAVGIWRGTGGGKTLVFNGHTDTVGKDGMPVDPPGGALRDGRVYGRGSLDMKGGCAAMIAAVKALRDAGVRLRGDVILACVADEEYASIGTEAFVREYQADGAVVCEPSGLSIGIAHRGFAWIECAVTGRAAHGSRPDLGVDAIVKAGRLLVALEELGAQLKKGLSHPLLGPASVHASLISGGTELSTYPDHCIVKIERRTIPGEDEASVVAEMETLLAGVRAKDPEFNASAKVFFHRPPFEVDRNVPLAAVMAESFRRVTGLEPEYMGFSGWLDSSILDQAGIPTVIFGPAGMGLHADTEWVDFESVVQTAEVLAAFAADFCGRAE